MPSDLAVVEHGLRHPDPKRVAHFIESLLSPLRGSGFSHIHMDQVLGRKDIRITMICIHVVNRGQRGVRGPADVLARRVPLALPVLWVG